MNLPPCALPMFLPTPERLLQLDLAQWDMVIRQAQRAQVAGRLTASLQNLGRLDEVPPQPRRHLESALTIANRQREAVTWEVRRLVAQLQPLGIPVILLKGAAYIFQELPCSRGRLFSDIDILVPHSALDDVERRLQRHGWIAEARDAYDQRYYRQWMHELPPLQHGRRGTLLDIHHTILPPTARLKPDARKLLKAARPVAGHEELYVLAPEDMVLHSATHLFHDGELEHGLRDLADLMDLTDHFAATHPGFWDELPRRAREMDLDRPLYYALRYLQSVLGRSIPTAVERELQDSGPPLPLRRSMDALFRRALRPAHRSCGDGFTATARWLLYVRSHWLRMPLHLLLPHLVRKAGRRTQRA